uniref:Uncharacterized protein n=1 Tax=uncultured Thiotrichaceae bacterium TaxID=298394 RepID=A0A6S6T9A9_9GAMM|nr:MAG: Unknown protein [uncultured Thiotrichaceae bacterium]
MQQLREIMDRVQMSSDFSPLAVAQELLEGFSDITTPPDFIV